MLFIFDNTIYTFVILIMLFFLIDHLFVQVIGFCFTFMGLLAFVFICFGVSVLRVHILLISTISNDS
jgi:hypothetical protein